MKVLIINSLCGIGSTGNIAVDLYKKLKNENHECKIIYGIDKAKKISIKDTYKMNNRFGYIIHNILSRLFDAEGFFSLLQTLKTINYIKKFKPDIINLINIHGHYINYPILFLYLKKIDIPIFWTIVDCWPITGHCAHFYYNNCNKWQTECKKCPYISSYPVSYIDFSNRNYNIKKKLFSSVNKLYIIPTSDWVANIYKLSFLFNKVTEPVYSGINLNIFKPTINKFRTKYNIPNDKKIILTVSSLWCKIKGWDDIIELSKIIPEKYQLVVVGLKKEQIPLLSKTTIAIEKTDSVNELVEIYSAADVYINPTLQETFGLTNVEALACGTPVITYNTGGCPEIINEKCGIVLFDKKPINFIDAIKDALKLKQEDCIKRATLFDKEKELNSYLQLFKNYKKNN